MPQDAVIVAQKDQIHPVERLAAEALHHEYGVLWDHVQSDLPATSRRTASGRHSPGSWSPPGRIQNTSPSSSSISPSRMISALDEWRILCPYASSPYKKVPVRPHRHPSFTESYLSSSSWRNHSRIPRPRNHSRCRFEMLAAFGHSMPPSNRVSSSTRTPRHNWGSRCRRIRLHSPHSRSRRLTP